MYGSTCPHLDGHMIKYLLTELGRELAAFVLYVIISSQIVSRVALPP